MSNYQKLNKIIRDIDVLIKGSKTAYSPDFVAWNNTVVRFLNKTYGESSVELKQFERIKYNPSWLGRWVAMSGTPEQIQEQETEIERVRIDSCRNGLIEAKAVLESFFEELSEEPSSKPYSQQNDTPSSAEQGVFIVHGHNKELIYALERQIERQGIKPIVFGEMANFGITTIIEKIEKNSNVGAAICLFTADDIGRAMDSDELKKRARQNVVFEAGYFIGKIGRNKVILVADREVELPSDLGGTVRIAYADSANWIVSVLQELKGMGYDIDLNNLS